MTIMEERQRGPAGRDRHWRAFLHGLELRSILWAGLAAFAGCAVAATLLWPPRPLLLWNASASSPIGLYAIAASRHARVGDLVVASAPLPARRLAAARHYLPFGVPLVKRVAAVPGDRICAKRRAVLVNGRVAALRRAHDPSGRPMLAWSGCRKLGAGDLLLLSPEALAFDGRYFGITKAADVIGTARLLWPR